MRHAAYHLLIRFASYLWIECHPSKWWKQDEDQSLCPALPQRSWRARGESQAQGGAEFCFPPPGLSRAQTSRLKLFPVPGYQQGFPDTQGSLGAPSSEV
jgi:hypothetical protein